MYTVVLAAALATASATPDFGRRCGGCYVSQGCYCSGGCYGCGGYGAGGAGSWGGAGYGSTGYWGGVYPNYGGYLGCYGYYGYGYPVHGYAQVPYGTAVNGPYAARFAQFSAVPIPPYYLGCTGCYGCYGGYSGYGIPVPPPALPVVRPQMPTKDDLPPINPPKDGKEPELVPAPKEKQKSDEKKTDSTTRNNLPQARTDGRAMVRIDVPVGGKLYVDGQLVNVSPGVRMFQTPDLAPGQTYFYDFRVDVAVRGIIQREERRILIHPGEDIAVSFENLRPASTATASR